MSCAEGAAKSAGSSGGGLAPGVIAIIGICAIVGVAVAVGLKVAYFNGGRPSKDNGGDGTVFSTTEKTTGGQQTTIEMQQQTTNEMCISIEMESNHATRSVKVVEDPRIFACGSSATDVFAANAAKGRGASCGRDILAGRDANDDEQWESDESL